MVAVLFTIYLFSWIDRLVVSMLVEPVKAGLHLTDFQMSLILGPSFAIVYAVFGIPLGWAADHYSRRLVIFFAALVWTLATIACGFAHSFEALLIARMFVGIGEAALLPSAYSLIADAFPRDKLTTATSTFQMAGKGGSAAAFGLGGIAIAWATGLGRINVPIHGPAEPWQLVMMLVGLPGFLLALLVFTFPEPARREPAGRQAAADHGNVFHFLRRHWQLVTLMMTLFSAMALCGYSMTAWVPTYIARHFHWSPAVYGPALSVMNLIGAASLVVNGWIVDRLYRGGMKDVHLRFYSWLIVIVSPALVAMFFVSNPWLFLACYAVAQFITVPFIVYLSSVLALLAPNSVRAQAIAIFMFVFNILGNGGGPALVGYLTDYVFHDEAKVGYSLAVVVISSAVIALTCARLSLKYLGPAVAARAVDTGAVEELTGA
jgi:MFS family permease